MVFAIEGHFLSGASALDSGITDILPLPGADGWALFTNSGRNGGLASFSVTTGGRVTAADTTTFAESWSQDLARDVTLAPAPAGGVELIVGTSADILEMFQG